MLGSLCIVVSCVTVMTALKVTFTLVSLNDYNVIYECNEMFLVTIKLGWMSVGRGRLGLTALLTQFRSYCAFKVKTVLLTFKLAEDISAKIFMWFCLCDINSLLVKT